MKKLLAAAIGFTLATASHAAVTTVDERTSLNLTLYQGGFAVVQDIRNVPIVEGVQEIEFKDISSAIISDSALLSGPGVEVLERNYTYDLVSFQSILEAHVGKEISLQLNGRHFSESYERMIWVQDAKLLAVRDGYMIVKARNLNKDLKESRFDRVFALPISKYADMVSFSRMPDELSESPTLSMKINSGTEGFTALDLTYLTEGLDWEASYVANIQEEDRLDLNAWVTLTNNTDLPFDQASVQLMAGEVNRASHPGKGFMAPERMLMADAVQARKAGAENVGDYKMFSLDSTVSLAAKQSKQVALFREEAVRFEKSYQLPLRLVQSFEERKATVSVSIENDVQSGLGRPLPAGIVRFYEDDKSGRQQFIGEVRLPDVDRNQHFDAAIGKAFGISLSNKVVAWEPEQGRVKGEMTAANGSENPVVVDLLLQSERVRMGNSYQQMNWCEQGPFSNNTGIEPIVDFDFGDTGVEIVGVSLEANGACRMSIRIPSDSRVSIPYQS